uniref:Myosin motor domain-containing protein n=1 Tax=Macrostomum lignano TaxID=282301 RepID=A0A1I8FIS2_9PLAT
QGGEYGLLDALAASVDRGDLKAVGVNLILARRRCQKLLWQKRRSRSRLWWMHRLRQERRRERGALRASALVALRRRSLIGDASAFEDDTPRASVLLRRAPSAQLRELGTPMRAQGWRAPIPSFGHVSGALLGLPDARAPYAFGAIGAIVRRSCVTYLAAKLRDAWTRICDDGSVDSCCQRCGLHLSGRPCATPAWPLKTVGSLRHRGFGLAGQHPGAALMGGCPAGADPTPAAGFSGGVFAALFMPAGSRGAGLRHLPADLRTASQITRSFSGLLVAVPPVFAAGRSQQSCHSVLIMASRT